MKPTPNSPSERGPVLVFGAHPDDIEFGCGGVVALETRSGRPAHFVVCSRGDAGSDGTPEKREAEAVRAAEILGATIEFVDLDGDARLEIRAAHAIALAAILRRVRPGIVLAPTLVENQHPDHARLGRLVRDATKLARFGGVEELRGLRPHETGQLLYYAIMPGSEPPGIEPVLIDVSDPEIGDAWTAAMEAHVSQTDARPYVEIQLARARVLGLRAGVGHAIALFPNDPLLFASLAELSRASGRF